MQILQNAVKQAEIIRLIHAATPDAGTKLEDVLKPEYWVHVAKQFAVNSRIEVIPADNAWFAELIIRTKTETGITVAALRYVDLNETVSATQQPGGCKVGFSGADKWRVVRLSDKKVVSSGHETKAAAEAWLAGNEQLV